MEQTQTLRELRKGHYFDSLEELLHRASIKLVHDALYTKVVSAKSSGVGVSEQEKMLSIMNEAIMYYAGMFDHCNKLERENFDLRFLNKTLITKNELLEKNLNAVEWKP